MTTTAHTVSPDEAGQRLDLLCVAQRPDMSRAAIQRAIKEGSIQVNGQAAKRGYEVREGDEITIGDLASAAATVAEPAPEPTILFEDNELVVIDKPAGLTMHPGVAAEQQTVASWFAERYPDARSIGEDTVRPGIVHRLDKDTSGVVVLAKTKTAYTKLKKQFQGRQARKEYLALIFGSPTEDDGRITRPLSRSKRNPLRRMIDPDGKPAITEWKTEQRLGDRFTLLRVFPFTGRMHQIRVHLHFLGFPIVGDPLYIFKRQHPPKGVSRQLLHAEKLTITMPSGGRKTFTAPLPPDFATVLQRIKNPNPPAGGRNPKLTSKSK